MMVWSREKLTSLPPARPMLKSVFYSDVRRHRTTAWPVRPGKFGWTKPTVEIESKSPSISKARVCSVFIHAGCQATSTLMTKRLSPRTRQWPEYAIILLKRAALSASFCGGWRSRTVSMTMKRPSAVRIRKPKGSGPYISMLSPVSVSSNFTEVSFHVPTSELRVFIGAAIGLLTTLEHSLKGSAFCAANGSHCNQETTLVECSVRGCPVSQGGQHEARPPTSGNCPGKKAVRWTERWSQQPVPVLAPS